ncbi:alkaline phosphatase D family protein [Paracidovorax citrulli]|uniref:Alkaline phosphatase n=1 Tax=Paracidovorax citrulli (strain AAC00-1) TaxID=397945 RepID=A1TM14_PARC0|nr:Alkaline phosphatase [Paracidovorax citrulli AAC00-1]ATG94959.1 alkaline phosphatase [Paracidovorax citrulli]PVY66191.1 alkaline phosphatase D [Paracidovorax citrulli]QCX11931.1 Alkaline phosphatase D [Paracidovorax citrulli]REG69636.1 alkaline phosphatase D [Paracidovorax citrulli]
MSWRPDPARHAPDRRTLLRLAAALAVPGALPRWAWSSPGWGNDPFALGVASGDPAPDGFVLWTRLMPPEPGGAAGPATVRWELAHDDRFGRIVRRGTATALPELAHSVHVELRGLEPGRWYFYRFLHGDAASPTGRTRTAPSLADPRPHLRLGFASCQRWEHGHYAAWNDVCRHAPDLVLFLGDYIYEYASPADPAGLARVHALRHARTLADFRDRYALHRSDAALQAAHAAAPWAVTWDDHEVENDYAGLSGREPEAAFADLRAAAYQAFYEHMPLRAATLQAGGGFGGLQLCRRLAWGRLARLHLLDARQFRSRQACRPQGSGGAGSVLPATCAELADPARSFLGMDQERWLDAGLAEDAAPAGDGSTPRWSVIAQQTLFSPRRAPSGRQGTDSWDGYPAARERLLASLAGRAPRNTVFLGGDIHQNYVCEVRGPAPDGPVLASEFCGTSISSRAGTTQDRVDAVARLNPHVLLARGDLRGWGLADVTPQRWTTVLRTVDDPLRPDSACSTLARFVVEDRRPGPVRD